MAKKWHKQLKTALGDIDYDFTPGRGHIRIVIRAHGKERKLTVSSTPSCGHALNQFERDLRKAVSEMKNGMEPGAMWAKN